MKCTGDSTSVCVCVVCVVTHTHTHTEEHERTHTDVYALGISRTWSGNTPFILRTMVETKGGGYFNRGVGTIPLRGVRFRRSRKAAPDCKASIRLSITPVSFSPPSVGQDRQGIWLEDMHTH